MASNPTPAPAVPVQGAPAQAVPSSLSIVIKERAVVLSVMSVAAASSGFG